MFGISKLNNFLLRPFNLKRIICTFATATSVPVHILKEQTNSFTYGILSWRRREW